jgi:hypothetical protein
MPTLDTECVVSPPRRGHQPFGLAMPTLQVFRTLPAPGWVSAVRAAYARYFSSVLRNGSISPAICS